MSRPIRVLTPVAESNGEQQLASWDQYRGISIITPRPGRRAFQYIRKMLGRKSDVGIASRFISRQSSRNREQESRNSPGGRNHCGTRVMWNEGRRTTLGLRAKNYPFIPLNWRYVKFDMKIASRACRSKSSELMRSLAAFKLCLEMSTEKQNDIVYDRMVICSMNWSWNQAPCV